MSSRSECQSPNCTITRAELSLLIAHEHQIPNAMKMSVAMQKNEKYRKSIAMLKKKHERVRRYVEEEEV
jgi:hypothetical protein